MHISIFNFLGDNMRKLTFAIVLLICIVSCNNDEEYKPNYFIGTWISNDKYYTYVFQNTTFTKTTEYYSHSGTYTYTDTMFTFNIAGSSRGSDYYYFSSDKNTIVFNNGGLILNRKSY
jgi:hypothetical protein